MHPAVYQYNQLVSEGLITQDPWEQATGKAKATANYRLLIVEHVRVKQAHLNMQNAIKEVLQLCESGAASDGLTAAYNTLNNPKAGSIRLWVKAFEQSGKSGLLPKYSGTNRTQYGWEVRVLELYHRPQKPSISKVARDLREMYGFRNAQDHNVRYFFNTLPADLQSKSPWRMGRKQYNDALREHVSRTTENLPVGVLFQGDGHTVDQYIKHPRTGKIWRPELTVFMDVRSRFIPGWYLSVAESSVSTMAALSHGMGTHNHVPALVHVDNGSGFKSKIMNAETTGFYASFGIEPIFALPGNAKAKNVERFFRTMEDDFGKDFDTYCGYDMSPDASRVFSSADKAQKAEAAGKIHIPTVEEWVEAFTEWLERYHNRPHPEYPNTTPALLWAELERTPVVDHNLLVKPREKVKVSRSLITLHKRKYTCDYIYQLEGTELIAEYDLHDDSTIRLFDLDGRWLTTAQLKSKKDYINVSRIKDAERKRLLAQEKRLHNKMEEKRAQAGEHTPLHVEQADELDSLEQSIQELVEDQQPLNDEFNLDSAMESLLKSAAPVEQPTDDYDPLDLYGETHGS